MIFFFFEFWYNIFEGSDYMNTQRIDNVLEKMKESKNYKDFTNLLSFDERKYIFYHLESYAETYSFIASSNFCSNIFKEEEAEEIYNNEFNELDGLLKQILICSLNIDLAKEVIKKIAEPDTSIVYSSFLAKLSSDKERIEWINNTDLSYLDAGSIFSLLVSNLEDFDLKLEYMKKHPEYKYYFQTIFKTINNDADLKKTIDFYKENFLEENDYNIVTLIEQFNDDNLKLQYLNIIEYGGFKSEIIASLKDEDLKISLLDTLDDGTIYSDNYKYDVIISIKDMKKRMALLSTINSITLKLIHAGWLDNVKEIYPEIIKKVAIENDLNYDNLLALSNKLGYSVIRNLSVNLKQIINLDKDKFNKLLQIIDVEKSHQLEMKDVDNIVEAIIQREFRIKNREVISVFPKLEHLIQNKDVNGIIGILADINNYIDINEMLNEHNINLEVFINRLLENENINILHEITNKYIESLRKKYLLERQKKVKSELNLEYAFEKNYLISKFFQKYNNEDIFKLLNREIDKSNLSTEQLELLNNKSLLIECLKFKRDPKNYSGDNLARSKAKQLNQILTILYLDKKLDFLGNKEDENAEIIYKTKKVPNDVFVGLMKELDINVLKNKIFNDSEMYSKLLNVFKSYKFIGWSNIFEKLLEGADLSFGERDVAVLINYFYSFYPKLEERLKNGLISNISLTTILDEIGTYGSSSVKYDYLLGKEDSKLIISNPSPNAAHLTVEQRLKIVPEEVKKQFSRKHITVPNIDKEIPLKKGKTIKANIGDVTSPINLTYGERTGACMRIGGAGSTLFDFCLENKNGFHVRLTDSVTNKLISRVSGFRNGNTIFLNQLRYSLDENITASDLIEAIKVVAKELVELTKTSEYPIKNVVISDGYVMEGKEKNLLNVENVQEGYKYFYSDVQNNNAIYLENNDKIELGPEKAVKYEVSRKKAVRYENLSEINEQIQRFNLINGLLLGTSLGDIPLVAENNIGNIQKLYVGEDFLLAFDFAGNIIIESILERDEYFKEKAKKEIDEIKKSLVKAGGKTI